MRKLLLVAALVVASLTAAASASATPMKLVVPAYWEEPPSTNWTQVENAAAALPNRVWAIADAYNGSPYDGPPARFSQPFYDEMVRMHNNRGKVFGYVDTLYMAHDLAGVKADILKWYQSYPIDGIFVDQSQYEENASDEAYYKAIYDYAKSLNSNLYVMTNPGAQPVENYLVKSGQRAADAICVYENRTGFMNYIASPWMLNYDRSNFATILYNVSSTKWQARLDHAWQQNLGWYYATDDSNSANPYERTPAYLSSMVTYLRTHYTS
jgi:Spherulation-specific family 4